MRQTVLKNRNAAARWLDDLDLSAKWRPKCRGRLLSDGSHSNLTAMPPMIRYSTFSSFKYLKRSRKSGSSGIVPIGYLPQEFT